MASVRNSIVYEKSHNDFNSHVRAVRNVFSLVSPSPTILLNSLEGITSIRAVMASAPFGTTIITVVMSSEGKSVTPG